MNNNHFFLGYEVSRGVSLRFSLLTQCVSSSCLGKPQLLWGRFFSDLPLLPLFWNTCPNHLVKVLGKHCLIITTCYLAGGFWNSVEHARRH